MNKIWILAVVTLFTSSIYASQKSNFSCSNVTHSLKISSKEIILKAKNLEQNESLKKLIAEKSGLTGTIPLDKIQISEVLIKIPAKDMSCATSGLNLVDCSGSSKKGDVEISASYNMMFASGSISLVKKPVRINLATIKTSLVSNGAVVLGNNPITVELDKLNAQSEIDIELQNQNITIDLSSSFELKECAK